MSCVTFNKLHSHCSLQSPHLLLELLGYMGSRAQRAQSIACRIALLRKGVPWSPPKLARAWSIKRDYLSLAFKA